MYKKIVLSLLPLSLFATSSIDLSEINKKISADKINNKQFVLDNLSNIKEQVLQQRIEKLKEKLDFKQEEQRFLENMLNVNLDKVNFLINQKKFNEAYVIHSNLEYTDKIKESSLDNFFDVINNNNFEKIKILDKKHISIILEYFFENLNIKNYSIDEIESLKGNILLTSDDKISKDDKYRFFRDISLLNADFVNSYNYSYNIVNENFVDKDIKKSIKNILLLQEEVFIKYYLQTNKETILNINKEGLK